jgi:hypothetical protein
MGLFNMFCAAVLLAQADDPEAGQLLDQLGVDVLPTVQFWRQGKLLWEHRGVNQMEQDIGEGVLYFGNRCVLQCYIEPAMQKTVTSAACSERHNLSRQQLTQGMLAAPWASRDHSS